MEASHKFLFETCFDPSQPLEAEVEEEEVVPPPPTFSEDELALARAQGFAEGRNEGITEMQASIDTRISALMEQMIQQLVAMDKVQADSLRASEQRLLGLASTIARKVVPTVAADAADAAVTDLIKDCLPKLLDEPRVVIRVHITLMEQLRGTIDTLAAKSGFAGDIILLPEDDFAETDCRIEWADGGAEQSSAALWADIDKTLDAFLPSAGPDTANTAQSTDTETENAQSAPDEEIQAEPVPEFSEENLNG